MRSGPQIFPGPVYGDYAFAFLAGSLFPIGIRMLVRHFLERGRLVLLLLAGNLTDAAATLDGKRGYDEEAKRQSRSPHS
jgi:hypothetical protein